ncbi:MAG: acetylglutamate kinase [bacterium]
MPLPFDKLDPRDQEKVQAELRAILREPDRHVAERRRRALARTLRPDYPDVADWVEDDAPATRTEQDHPVLAGLPINKQKVDALRDRTVLIKYGGNAMVDEALKQEVIADICILKSLGAVPVVVHGGGPAISKLLGEVGLESRFIAGHRKTDRRVMGYVEMALSGKVNSEIVKLIGFHGFKSVGISGKDGGLVTARKRIHRVREGGKVRRSDLGQVGDVESIQPDLVHTLAEGGYIPVIAPIGVGDDLEDYNINADMFAGHMAAALDAAAMVALTDVDGLLLDKDDPATLIPEITAHAAREESGRIIQGGMIPKVEACLAALEGGVPRAHIVNGMTPHSLLTVLLTDRKCGTTITGGMTDTQEA